MPPATPTKFATVSSTMPFTFGVTATGRFQSVTHRRIRGAFAESIPRPITTSGREDFASRSISCFAALVASAYRTVVLRARAPADATSRAGLSASRADSVRYAVPNGRVMHAAIARGTTESAFSAVIFSANLVTGRYTSWSGSS